jgi:hypothetical protein
MTQTIIAALFAGVMAGVIMWAIFLWARGDR